MVGSLRVRINLAPTQHVRQRLIGAGFTPARVVSAPGYRRVIFALVIGIDSA